MRQTLEEWIKEIRQEGEEDVRGLGPLTGLALVHMKGTAPDELHVIDLKPGKRTYTDQQIAEICERKAHSYAQDLPGIQTFCLWAYFGDERKPKAQHPFVIEGEAANTGLATEGPHPQGLTQQAMRHTESMHSLIFRQSQSLFQAMQGVTTMMARENEHLRAENFEARRILGDLMMQKMTDDSAVRLREQQMAQQMKDRELLMKFAPALINTIMGKEVFPQSTADSAMLDSLVEGLADLPQDRLMSLAEYIKPEMLGPLMAKANAFLDKRKAEAEKLHALAKTTVSDNPERDAAGE